jgi:hypothetical protein
MLLLTVLIPHPLPPSHCRLFRLVRLRYACLSAFHCNFDNLVKRQSTQSDNIIPLRMIKSGKALKNRYITNPEGVK